MVSTEVSKAEFSDSIAHQERQPYQRAFEYSEYQRESRCALFAEGNHEALKLTLMLARGSNDPSPEIVAHFSIPREGYLYSIRLFDQSRSMDVHVEPKPKTKFAAKARAEARYWSIAFRAHDETELYNTKRMLRRLENLTLEMPDEWFTYRNYFTRTPNVGDEADETQQSGQPSVEVGRNRVELAGGHSITFTGALASFEWLSLEGHENIRQSRSLPTTEGQRDPEAPVTRLQSARQAQGFPHTSLKLGIEPGKGTYQTASRLGGSH